MQGKASGRPEHHPLLQRRKGHFKPREHIFHEVVADSGWDDPDARMRAGLVQVALGRGGEKGDPFTQGREPLVEVIDLTLGEDHKESSRRQQIDSCLHRAAVASLAIDAEESPALKQPSVNAPMARENVPSRHDVKGPRRPQAYLHHHMPVAGIAVIRANEHRVAPWHRLQLLHSGHLHLAHAVMVAQHHAVQWRKQAHPQAAGARRPESGHLSGDDPMAHGAGTLPTAAMVTEAIVTA